MNLIFIIKWKKGKRKIMNYVKASKLKYKNSNYLKLFIIYYIKFIIKLFYDYNFVKKLIVHVN